MLKQPTTTYAGEKSSCTVVYNITIHSQPSKSINKYLTFASIQSEAPFEGAYGNLKRLFDKAAKMYHQVKKQEMKKLSPSRQRWGGFAGFQRDRKLCTHENKRLQQRKNRRQSFEKSQLSIGPIWYSVKPLSLRVRWIFVMVFLYIRMISYINEEVFLVVLHSLFIIRIIQITIVHEANEINRFFLPLARRTMQLCFIYIMTHYSAVVCSVWKLFAAVCIALS